MPGTIFFSRCKPQNADVVDIALRERRVFIGYPAWIPGAPRDRHRLRGSMADLTMPEAEWQTIKSTLDKSAARIYQANRNLFSAVDIGAIALIPRPVRGVVYAGRVVRRFELLDDPVWADEYLSLRKSSGLDASDAAEHVADVAQCCEVDDFRALPLPALPAWIRKSLFGRATAGRLWPISDHDLDPFDYIGGLLDGLAHVPIYWTLDISEVRRRLLAAVSPNGLEHLCVALLQLEHPDEIWAHVGGSGDGGVDGIGMNAAGSTVGLLQCKWTNWEGPVFDATSDASTLRLVLASLLHPEMAPKGVIFWGLDMISELVLKHAERLPAAISMRVGQTR